MKVYILEDEVHILNYIRSLIEEFPYCEVVGTSTGIMKAKEEILHLEPDLILADIHLRDGNSLSLFKQIDLTGQLVFITAYDKYAIEALNIGAFAYLLKPIDTDQFQETIERNYHNREENKVEKSQFELAEEHLEEEDKPIDRIALKS